MKSGWIAVVFFVAAIFAAFTIAIAGRTQAKGVEAKSNRVARGEYLVTVMGCGDCHTPGTLYGSPDFKRKLSGSELGWRGPWGVSYPRNLTPDVETGIGKWSEKDIVTALRTGMRSDGSVLQPPMPWPNLTALTDEDAYAVAAFLKSLPPISHKVPDRVAPGQPAAGSVCEFPPPSAWDAPREAESAKAK
jgi:mono/diheme cytochrome c family protein